MEKRKPHYALATVQDLVACGKYIVTKTALRSAVNDFGITEESDLGVWVRALNRTNFYKSMTTNADSTIWQDVYRMAVKGVDAYIKVQIVRDGAVIISFKYWETDWL